MSYKKQQVESTLKRTISRIVTQRLSDPRIEGMVSVTRVDVAPDGHQALVYVSVLPDKSGPKSLHGLRHAAGRIHSLVSKNVAMRYVPRLAFRLDESLKKQATVLEAIQRGIQQDGAMAEDRNLETDGGESAWARNLSSEDTSS